ncbi:hypothetical protein [Streptomyces roseochromogenus]|uniref:hypothetical protein n=1 Tax=Streptomyces roseochromogenus TaxID=285450 RepID=UPI000997D841|nr:hypothetical protein [Streptomyces roseochromogenus]
MTQPSSSITPEEIKHLEFIQAVVTRLGNGSFLIKGWTMTAVGIFFGILASHLSWKIAATGLIPIAGFWLLDSYYLRQERLFRRLYEDVRNPAVEVSLFSMNVQPYHSAVPWKGVVMSRTMLNFYATLAAVDVAFIGGALVKAIVS